MWLLVLWPRWILGMFGKSKCCFSLHACSLELTSLSSSEFGLAFLDAKERCNARTRHSSFDTSVLEINHDDLKVFLEALCEGPEY